MTKKEVQGRLKEAQVALTVVKEELFELLGEMEGAFDERSGKWQQSVAGEAWQEATEFLREHLDALEELVDLELFP